jgi:VIT1/CCC1 family predicted Fe2+/Mn2+ transporter/rubrerythrin
MATAEDLKRYRANLQGEIDARVVYLALSEAESSAPLAEIYRRLAAVEEKHAKLWEDQLLKAGAKVPAWKPTPRARVKAWLAKRAGPQWILPTMAAAETADRGMYDDQPESAHTELPADERSHAKLLWTMVRSAPMEGGAFARFEGRHRAVGGNALRAAVLGANDGLLSNFSLMMGVVGAEVSHHATLVTGLAGLMAGAFSMAIGEWISVQSSRELNENQLAIEADELASAPAQEEEELALIYQAKGLSEGEAKSLASRLINDKDKALDTLAREELGIDPKELGGSPWEAAAASFVLFALGALVPVAPFFVFSGTQAVVWAAILSMIGLFSIGAAITLVTGRPLWISGLRQLLFGLIAASVTFGIGHLLGVQAAG